MNLEPVPSPITDELTVTTTPTNEIVFNNNFSFRTTVLFWLAVFRDLVRLLRPILILGGVASVGLLLATTTTLKFRS